MRLRHAARCVQSLSAQLIQCKPTDPVRRGFCPYTTTANTLDCIHLEGLTFYGYHGAFKEENALGQRFTVDAQLWCDLSKAAKTDNLEDTVNYAQVFRDIQEVVEGPPRALLESVAETLANTVLERHAIVHRVRLKLSKPHVAIPGVLKNVAIEITRDRK